MHSHARPVQEQCGPGRSAIPAIAANNILRNRIARLVLEVGIVSEGLMSRFQNMGTKKKDLE